MEVLFEFHINCTFLRSAVEWDTAVSVHANVGSSHYIRHHKRRTKVKSFNPLRRRATIFPPRVIPEFCLSHWHCCSFIAHIILLLKLEAISFRNNLEMFKMYSQLFLRIYEKVESRNRPGVAQRVPGGLGSQIFMTFGTWSWWGCQPHAPAIFTSRKYS
jgi:hypothetical protein